MDKRLKPKTWLSWLTRLERHELEWLLVGLGGCILLLIFLKLSSEVMGGNTLAFDKRIVMAFRKKDDLSQPIGPSWMATSVMDLTALGGPTIIGLIVAAVIGFLLLQSRYRTAFFIFLTAISGEVVSFAMKSFFFRPRPDVVPHLREASSTSFPSGHAMQSAIIYLTLGAILMRLAERRLTKVYCCAVAMGVTFLVGVSRIYLGVHYPTDVLAGWIIGLMWASICWLVAQHYEVRAGLKAERKKSA
ncbi:MAG TPA: phosphatase PAP2 family protein [Vicinamibacterales bacterium]|nr:phosphatase PAP2 family protein [Vicinamibacterales bacterium]